MKNESFKWCLTLMVLSLFSFMARSQDVIPKRSFEMGLSGAMMNLTRTSVTDFHQTEGGDYIFTLEQKFLYGGAGLYAALELRKAIYLDAQATLGLTRYYNDGVLKQGGSLMAGPGLQLRPFTRSEWIQPYIRVGLNYYRKDFPTRYFGQFDGDVTKEAVWKAEDDWNKGYTFDSDSFFSFSAGLGVIGWLGNRFGVRFQGQYLKTVGSNGACFAQADGGILFRFGGIDKRKVSADRYVRANLSDYDAIYRDRLPERTVEVVKEKPVEKVIEKEVVKYIASEKTLSELMDNVTFDFDKSTITSESDSTLDVIAQTLVQNRDDNFLVAGYTDSKGSDDYNDRLSFERARAVFNALLIRGVSVSRIACRGFGKRVAIAPSTASDQQRKSDRKVVLERITDEEYWKYLQNKPE